MSQKLAKQLIRLGEERPDLRNHLRPILDTLTASGGSPSLREVKEKLKEFSHACLDNREERDNIAKAMSPVLGVSYKMLRMTLAEMDTLCLDDIVELEHVAERLHRLT